MCGIAGYVAFRGANATDLTLIHQMTKRLGHRGPDDIGYWADAKVIIGHSRLAIIDVPGGSQPLHSHRPGKKGCWISYNGEVFNFKELRSELLSNGAKFHTHSDTEVVAQAYLAWGKKFVDKLNGMFAVCIWDADREVLLLVRDRGRRQTAVLSLGAARRRVRFRTQGPAGTSVGSRGRRQRRPARSLGLHQNTRQISLCGYPRSPARQHSRGQHGWPRRQP